MIITVICRGKTSRIFDKLLLPIDSIAFHIILKERSINLKLE